MNSVKMCLPLFSLTKHILFVTVIGFLSLSFCISPAQGALRLESINKEPTNRVLLEEFESRIGENSNINKINMLVDLHQPEQRHKRQSFDTKKESEHFVDLIFNGYGNTQSISMDRFIAFLSNIGLDEMNLHLNKTIRNDPHFKAYTTVDSHDHDDTDGHSHSDEDTGHDDNHKNGDKEKCINITTLLQNYGLQEQAGISAQDFIYICPALLYQIDTGGCGHTHAPVEPQHHNGTGVSTVDHVQIELVWLYTMLSVLVISLCALFGILCIPRNHTGNGNKTIQLLIALAMSSMSGDAMLHLIPHAMAPMGEHGSHEEDNSGEQGDNAHDHLSSLYKGLIALVGIYSFFFFERIFAIIRSSSQRKKAKRSGVEIAMLDGKDLSDAHDNSHGHSHEGMLSCSSLAFVIILGDIFHNFCDGVAIGAGFAGGISVGISTSIAVFCHELPHEIGDFAVLVSSGMSRKKAVFYNLMSTIPSFFGAAIGLEIGSLGGSSLWIFAFVGGLFLYISLVNLVPEMSRVYDNAEGHWSSYLIMHCVGIALGLGIMVVLGIYEKDLQNMLTS